MKLLIDQLKVSLHCTTSILALLATQHIVWWAAVAVIKVLVRSWPNAFCSADYVVKNKSSCRSKQIVNGMIKGEVLLSFCFSLSVMLPVKDLESLKGQSQSSSLPQKTLLLKRLVGYAQRLVCHLRSDCSVVVSSAGSGMCKLTNQRSKTI